MRKALKKAREEKKLSVKEIAEMIGVTPSVYYKWENGTRYPQMENAKQVSEILNKTVDELFFKEELDKLYKTKIV